MITGSEVVDSNGHVLTKANEVLSDSHILLLKMWGINEVDVQCESLVISADFAKDEVSIIAETVEDKFALHSDDCPVAGNLKSYMLDKLLREREI